MMLQVLLLLSSLSDSCQTLVISINNSAPIANSLLIRLQINEESRTKSVEVVPFELMHLFLKSKKHGGEAKRRNPISKIRITQEEDLSYRREKSSAFIVRKRVI